MEIGTPVTSVMERICDGRIGWKSYYLGIAAAVSARADCTRAKHGAVLVRPDRTICSVGFNGSRPGGPSCLLGECPRGLLSRAELPPMSSYDSGVGLCHALHAEQNACAFAREDTTGYSMYITGEPCLGCVKTMRAHRLAAAYWGSGSISL